MLEARHAGCVHVFRQSSTFQVVLFWWQVLLVQMSNAVYMPGRRPLHAE
jgi:hypothetical protein